MIHVLDVAFAISMIMYYQSMIHDVDEFCAVFCTVLLQQCLYSGSGVACVGILGHSHGSCGPPRLLILFVFQSSVPGVVRRTAALICHKTGHSRQRGLQPMHL
jgi:hypothetical protein